MSAWQRTRDKTNKNIDLRHFYFRPLGDRSREGYFIEFYATTRVSGVMWSSLPWNRMQQLAAGRPSGCSSGLNSVRDPWINISSRTVALRFALCTFRTVLSSLVRSRRPSFFPAPYSSLAVTPRRHFMLLRFIRFLLLDVLAREIDAIRLTTRTRGKCCHSNCGRSRALPTEKNHGEINGCLPASAYNAMH